MTPARSEAPPDSPASWSEQAHGKLARSGHTRGGARSQIIDLLDRQACALTALEIEDALRSGGRPIGRATIYRTLDLLVELGLVERLAVGDGQARFERVDPGGSHHHHLLCGTCGRLVAFDDPALESALDSLSARLDMRIEHHDVLLRGACFVCR